MPHSPQSASTFPGFSLPVVSVHTSKSVLQLLAKKVREIHDAGFSSYTLSDRYSSRFHFAERLVFLSYFVGARIRGSVFAPYLTDDKIRQFYERHVLSDYLIRTFYDDLSICHPLVFPSYFPPYNSSRIPRRRFLGCFFTLFVSTSY